MISAPDVVLYVAKASARASAKALEGPGLGQGLGQGVGQDLGESLGQGLGQSLLQGFSTGLLPRPLDEGVFVLFTPSPPSYPPAITGCYGNQ